MNLRKIAEKRVSNEKVTLENQKKLYDYLCDKNTLHAKILKLTIEILKNGEY